MKFSKKRGEEKYDFITDDTLIRNRKRLMLNKFFNQEEIRRERGIGKVISFQTFFSASR